MENTKNDCTWSEKFPSWHVMYLANIKPVCLGLCCWNGDPGKGPYITLIALPPRLWASHSVCVVVGQSTRGMLAWWLGTKRSVRVQPLTPKGHCPDTQRPKKGGRNE